MSFFDIFTCCLFSLFSSSLPPPYLHAQFSATAFLRLVCLAEGLHTRCDHVDSLVAWTRCDLRRSLLSLQIWAAAGGGTKLPTGLILNAEQEPNEPSPCGLLAINIYFLQFSTLSGGFC